MRTRLEDMVRQTADEIDRQAAQWLARADRGLSSEEEGELDAWLAADIRRVGAYGRMRAATLHAERSQVLSPGLETAVPSSAAPSRGLSRRRLFAAGGGLAAAAAGATAIGLGWMFRGQTHATGLGEVRVEALSDGSLVTLNTASRIRVNFSESRRTIHLLEGEALFDVAKDAARPFIVDAGDTVVRAIGTSFTVKKLKHQSVQVLVREGQVEVRKPAGGGRPVSAVANTRVVSTSASPAAPLAAVAVEPETLNRALAWRQGRIVFEGETLLEAAQEFARYSDTRIVMDDPTLAAERVSGLYQANDPVGFAQAIAVAFNFHVEVHEGEVRLSRSA